MTKPQTTLGGMPDHPTEVAITGSLLIAAEAEPLEVGDTIKVTISARVTQVGLREIPGTTDEAPFAKAKGEEAALISVKKADKK